MNVRTVLGFVLCFLLAGCYDSNVPLSDPQTSKADEGLVGVWRDVRGGCYYHIGHAGKPFPKSVMRVVEVAQDETDVGSPQEYLVYPTVLGHGTYLNVISGEEVVATLDEEGWKPETVKAYTFVKYRLDGDMLTVWSMDESAKERAIKSGKIKGVIEKDKPATFTDTSANVARFVTEAGDALWDAKEPDLLRFQRLTLQKKNEKPASSSLYPLGSMFLVDENGINWCHGRRVGISGVDGRMPVSER